MALTQELGQFVSGLNFARIPEAAAATVRTGFADTIATMIAGAHDPAPQLLRQGLAPAAGPASLYFSGESAAAPEAAWINGTAGHALDYDDVALHGHPSTVLVEDAATDPPAKFRFWRGLGEDRSGTYFCT